MKDLSHYIKNHKDFATSILRYLGVCLPDKLYLKWMFRLEMGYKLNLKKPQTFSEKLQWLKLYDRKQIYTTMVDKYAVKKYVAKTIGEEHVIPTFGVWETPEEIDWERLPDQFVLKTTHDGGGCGVVICKNKDSFDKDNAVSKLRQSLRHNTYKGGREWPYKNVPRRIIAEQLLEARPEVADLPDYKWYCFNGEPKYCQVIQDRHTKETIDFFDTEWNHQKFVGLNPVAAPAAVMPRRPKQLETQIRIAQKMSKGLHFARIDLFETCDKTYFGEITFYPMSGLGVFSPEKYNLILGQMLELPDNKNKR